MTQVIDVEARLTADELEQVRLFAEFLVARRMGRIAPAVATPTHRISFEGWAGCLAHVHPEMSDAEFKQMILDERAREADE